MALEKPARGKPVIEREREFIISSGQKSDMKFRVKNPTYLNPEF